MIETYLTQTMLVRGETSVGDYLRTGQTDYALIMRESWNELMRDLIDKRADPRKLCKRLSLQASATKTAAFNGAISDEDFAKRMRLIIIPSVLTGTVVFTLQGTNDNATNYYDVKLVDDDGSEDTAVTITDTEGTYSYLLSDMFKQYRLQLVSIGTTITYSAYMIEDVFTYLHLLKTRENIYRSLVSEQGDDYDYKRGIYENKYNMKLAEADMSVDMDEDDTITEGEKDSGNLEVIFH